MRKSSSKRKRHLGVKILLGVLLVILAIVIGINIYIDHVLNSVNYDNSNKGGVSESDLQKEADRISIDDVERVNILLVGEEAIGSADGKGRTDSMMIVTLDKEDKSLKLTSVMRDLYVEIPNYGKRKLNDAYELGGPYLLMETITQNFDLPIDGYVHVGFNDFEELIDKLGGVELTLTEAEAKYLNKTNYISKKKYRNVAAGTHTLNGNQVLGYARVRYVKAADGQRDDFGRTARHRAIINAIFEKYKTKNIIEMLSLLNETASYVTTDVPKDEIKKYIKLFVTLGITNLETNRLPADGAYSPEKQLIDGKYRSVLVPDIEKNKQAINEFINNEPAAEAADGTNIE